jgi:hypothetical protein
MYTRGARRGPCLRLPRRSFQNEVDDRECSDYDGDDDDDPDADGSDHPTTPRHHKPPNRLCETLTPASGKEPARTTDVRHAGCPPDSDSTFALASGARPDLVSHQLGHASIAITRTYRATPTTRRRPKPPRSSEGDLEELRGNPGEREPRRPKIASGALLFFQVGGVSEGGFESPRPIRPLGPQPRTVHGGACRLVPSSALTCGNPST